MNYEQNPELFRELSQPFDSEEKLSEAIRLFSEEVAELRKKYALTNIIIGIGDSCIVDGKETQMISIKNLGDIFQCATIAAAVANKLESNIHDALKDARGWREK